MPSKQYYALVGSGGGTYNPPAWYGNGALSAKKHFNFSGVTEPITGANHDPVVSAYLKLNNQRPRVRS